MLHVCFIAISLGPAPTPTLSRLLMTVVICQLFLGWDYSCLQGVSFLSIFYSLHYTTYWQLHWLVLLLLTILTPYLCLLNTFEASKIHIISLKDNQQTHFSTPSNKGRSCSVTSGLIGKRFGILALEGKGYSQKKNPEKNKGSGCLVDLVIDSCRDMQPGSFKRFIFGLYCTLFIKKGGILWLPSTQLDCWWLSVVDKYNDIKAWSVCICVAWL